MSILNILIYIAGGIIVFTYGFFAIRKFKKWKNRTEELVKQGQKIEIAKTNAYNEIYKKGKKAKTENKDTPFIE